MDAVNREHELTQLFIALADTLTVEHDVVELLDRLTHACVDLLEVSAAGLMLADQRGSLRVMASSSEKTRLLELFQLQNDDGPCLDCFHSGQPVSVLDLASEEARWPHFAPHAQAVGFKSVHARPMRLRDQTIGAFNLFHTDARALPEADLQVAQALADVATIGILSQRAGHRSEVVTEQLQTALNGRIIIEQAKGMLAELGGIDTEEAFVILRAYARANKRRLSDLARDLVKSQLPPEPVLAQQHINASTG